MHGPFDSDDGDVLTGWALAGRGIVNKPRFEVEPYIRDGRLKVILASTPPTPVQFAAVYPHKKFQDPKVRLLLDFMADRCQRLIPLLLFQSGPVGVVECLGLRGGIVNLRSDATEGFVQGACEKQRSKSSPSAASRSRFGETSPWKPWQPR